LVQFWQILLGTSGDRTLPENFKQNLLRTKKAMEHNFITIVSGLPRSGTSMMMQALQVGGMPVLTDNIRESDIENPKGYYEFEPVKKTRDDPSWVPQAVGKVVKIIYRLLYDLPEGYEYRVIFMDRNIAEILVSQRTMLERTGQKGADISDEKLAQLLKKDLNKAYQWVKDQENFSMISVGYKDMVQNPLPQCGLVNDFLGNLLDTDKMASVIDPSLYRNRQ
jgi:hypothetical protein